MYYDLAKLIGYTDLGNWLNFQSYESHVAPSFKACEPLFKPLKLINDSCRPIDVLIKLWQLVFVKYSHQIQSFYVLHLRLMYFAVSYCLACSLLSHLNNDLRTTHDINNMYTLKSFYVNISFNNESVDTFRKWHARLWYVLVCVVILPIDCRITLM